MAARSWLTADIPDFIRMDHTEMTGASRQPAERPLSFSSEPAALLISASAGAVLVPYRATLATSRCLSGKLQPGYVEF
jgi:hypothetical protein